MSCSRHCFNSRTPGGVRLGIGFLVISSLMSFNSRTPGGVRLGANDDAIALYNVSIHAPREGCDQQDRTATRAPRCFNSRTPGGVRLDVSSSANLV